MRLITTVAEMKEFAREARRRGKSLGLVPTMGALHDGHRSLVLQAKQQCDVNVVSIFVNPTQFAPSEDFARYPKTPESDLDLLRSLKVDAVFAPTVQEMYPEGFETQVDPGEIAKPWEGASRPGHFRGVATVVLKLFSIVSPDFAYFGQKDFQQTQVVRQLIEDLNLDVRLVICPIVREPDGLARSSRNTYLNPDERNAALAISRSLRRAEEVVHGGETNASIVVEEMRKILAVPKIRIDYVAIVEPTWLRSVERVQAGAVALVAASVGTTRLIDNLIFGPPGTNPELRIQLSLTARTFADGAARLPGLDVEALRQRIDRCRECAALSSILLPPREYLAKYLQRDYPDLNTVRVVVIGRDAPLNPEHSLYRNPTSMTRFTQRLYELLGTKDFAEFKTDFILTDAIRCHSHGTRIPEKALSHCARHLRDELKLYPRLETVIVLGEDASFGFQQFILGRSREAIKPFEQLVREKGWGEERVSVSLAGERPLRVLYAYHPTYDYKRSPSLVEVLKSLTAPPADNP